MGRQFDVPTWHLKIRAGKDGSQKSDPALSLNEPIFKLIAYATNAFLQSIASGPFSGP
jgi:hypothetical protein